MDSIDRRESPNGTGWLTWHLPHRRLHGAKRRRHHRVIEYGALVIFAIWLLVFTLRANGLSIRAAHPSWLVAAFVLEIGPMASFARVQRITLKAGGIRIPVLEALRITYSSNAVSVTVPVAGSAAATAHTASEDSHRGADSGLIAWTLMITGVVSTIAFALLIALGAVFPATVLPRLPASG